MSSARLALDREPLTNDVFAEATTAQRTIDSFCSGIRVVRRCRRGLVARRTTPRRKGVTMLYSRLTAATLTRGPRPRD